MEVIPFESRQRFASSTNRQPSNPMTEKLLRPLCSILGAALLAISSSRCIKRTTDHVIADTRQVLYSAPADQDHGVLLQIVTDSRNVSGNFHSVREPDSRDLAQSGVRFLRRLSPDYKAYTALLRVALKGRRLGLFLDVLSAFSYKLANSRQTDTPLALS